MKRLRDVFLLKSKEKGIVEIRLEFDNDRFHSIIVPVRETNPYDLAGMFIGLAHHIRSDPHLREIKKCNGCRHEGDCDLDYPRDDCFTNQIVTNGHKS